MSAFNPYPSSQAQNTTTRRGAPIHRGATLKRNQSRAPQPGDVLPITARPSSLIQPIGRTLTRAKTLTRPDRFVAPAPLINAPLVSAASPVAASHSWWQPWSFYVTLSTIWCPNFLLSACGIRQPLVQRAWREKVALCSICLILGGFVGFATIGLNSTLCPSNNNHPTSTIRIGQQQGLVGINGIMYEVANTTTTSGINFKSIASTLSGQDISGLFDRTDDDLFPACSGHSAAFATVNLCTNATNAASKVQCALPAPNEKEVINTLHMTNTTTRVGYSWGQVADIPNYMVIDGVVLNMNSYILAHPNGVSNDTVDTAIRQILFTQDNSSGKDATRLFKTRKELSDSIHCIQQRYRAGVIDKITPGCFASRLFLYVSLVVILGIVLARFAMACVFAWFLSRQLVKPPKNLKRSVVSPAVMPEGANLDINNKDGTAPWTKTDAAKANAKLQKPQRLDEKAMVKGKKAPAPVDADGMINMASIGAELFCVCLVTCYSEDESSISATLDSIAATDYSDARKLLFVVCDGIVTGKGAKKSTPDICIDLIERDERFGLDPKPASMSYLAVGSGSKAKNEALVYAGHYTRVKGHRTPIIVVVKQGTEEEAKEAKPGNRGKRDGQMILMNFFSRVTYNDRMTPLDYDLFRKTQALMGVTPDFFEVCLMVDADTKVYPDSLTALVNCMQHDPLIMGVCGETRIENKRQSWVTAIQVYEYFISHHLAKGFESVFGGVTCLPGCFSMYRLKARKQNDSDWVPILVQSEITREYNQSEVETLHQKNLLLLGEDRFLTTIMIRTFPNRKMMFCPQAKCRTIVPDEFKVLLSQRRRWINSTVHNLMELVRVPNLCGTFCFSMQFIVFMELLGTVVLPVAICLTYSLIIHYIIKPPAGFADAIPLILLFAVLGLPAVLILITTGKVIYVVWLLIYIAALPVWNFILPAYSFWHFDDFSWGETRKVAGEGKDLGHVSDSKTIEVNAVPLRRWADWERSRLRKLKRDERRRREMERSYAMSQMSRAQSPGSNRWDAETASLATQDDDRYGMQIGQYNEEASPHALPPVGLYAVDDSSSVTLAGDQMAAILDEGWEEDDDQAEYLGGDRSMMAQAVTFGPSQSSYSINSLPHVYSVSLSDNGVVGDSSTNLVQPHSPFATSFTSINSHQDLTYTDLTEGRVVSPTYHDPAGRHQDEERRQRDYMLARTHSP